MVVDGVGSTFLKAMNVVFAQATWKFPFVSQEDNGGQRCGPPRTGFSA